MTRQKAGCTWHVASYWLFVRMAAIIPNTHSAPQNVRDDISTASAGPELEQTYPQLCKEPLQTPESVRHGMQQQTASQDSDSSSSSSSRKSRCTKAPGPGMNPEDSAASAQPPSTTHTWDVTATTVVNCHNCQPHNSHISMAPDVRMTHITPSTCAKARIHREPL
jgi:hypothetical protein